MKAAETKSFPSVNHSRCCLNHSSVLPPKHCCLSSCWVLLPAESCMGKQTRFSHCTWILVHEFGLAVSMLIERMCPVPLRTCMAEGIVRSGLQEHSWWWERCAVVYSWGGRVTWAAAAASVWHLKQSNFSGPGGSEWKNGRPLNMHSSNNFPSCYLAVLPQWIMKDKRGGGRFSTAGLEQGLWGGAGTAAVKHWAVTFFPCPSPQS